VNQHKKERNKKTPEDFEGDIDDNESVESVSDDEFDKYLDHFMGDIDKDEIDLDEDDKNNVEDIASTVQRVHRTNESADDDDDEIDNRPFTLNDGDELSDDEQLDDNEHETISNQHIHDNFKVDNEREMKQIKWELDRERTYAHRSRRYDKHIKKTSRRKPKLTRREKRRQMNTTNIKKKHSSALVNNRLKIKKCESY